MGRSLKFHGQLNPLILVLDVGMVWKRKEGYAVVICLGVYWSINMGKDHAGIPL